MTTEEKPDEQKDKQDGEGLLQDLQDFPNPAADGSMDLTDEEAWEDFERSGQEQRGQRPPPYKTWGFWLSALSTVLTYLVMSQLIPAGSLVYTGLLIAVNLLGFFGYARLAERLGSASPDPNGRPNWRRPGFILSFLSVTTSYALGAGAAGTSIVTETAIQIAQVLGFIGVNISPWRRRRSMVDPREEPTRFGLRLLELLVSLVTLFRRRK